MASSRLVILLLAILALAGFVKNFFAGETVAGSSVSWLSTAPTLGSAVTTATAAVISSGELAKPTTRLIEPVGRASTTQPQHHAHRQMKRNPHIVPIAVDEGIAAALDVMRRECRAHVPLLHSATWKNQTAIKTLYNNQAYYFDSNLVCYDDQVRWYRDSDRPRPLQEASNAAEFKLKASAQLHALVGNKSFEAALLAAARDGRFFFHRSLGILSVGNWGTVSIYHFLMDLLMGMVSLILSNPELESIPRDTIQMHENHIAQQAKWSLPPCFECLAVAPIVTDNLYQPNITISYVGPVDQSMRCFCGLVFVHHQTLTSRAPCCSKPMITRSHVSDIMMWMKQKLVEKWQFRPYGEAVLYDDYAKYGYWLNSSDPRKPRLLFLLRTKSRFIGRKEELMQAARDVGFAVHSMAFETETMERQFAAGRYADVVVGTHGAALTTTVMMDTTDILCRSMIEMFHWAPLGRIVHYQKVAYMVNISALGVQPIDVVFGKSVANPRRERQKLKSFSYTWSGTGFHDQTSFYHTQTFRERLMDAIRNLKRCRNVDTSTMARVGVE